MTKVDVDAGIRWGVATALSVLAGGAIYAAVNRQMGWVKRTAIYAAAAGVGVGGVRALIIKAPQQQAPQQQAVQPDKVAGQTSFKSPVQFMPRVAPGAFGPLAERNELVRGGEWVGNSQVHQLVEEVALHLKSDGGSSRVYDTVLRLDLIRVQYAFNPEEGIGAAHLFRTLPPFENGEYHSDWIVPILGEYPGGGHHFWMIFLDFSKKEVVIADSLAGLMRDRERNGVEEGVITTFLTDLQNKTQRLEEERQLPADFAATWTFVRPDLSKARQYRGDCGIFSVIFMAWMAHRLPLDQWQIAEDWKSAEQVNAQIDAVRHYLYEATKEPCD